MWTLIGTLSQEAPGRYFASETIAITPTAAIPTQTRGLIPPSPGAAGAGSGFGVSAGGCSCTGRTYLGWNAGARGTSAPGAGGAAGAGAPPSAGGKAGAGAGERSKSGIWKSGRSKSGKAPSVRRPSPRRGTWRNMGGEFSISSSLNGRSYSLLSLDYASLGIVHEVVPVLSGGLESSVLHGVVDGVAGASEGPGAPRDLARMASHVLDPVALLVAARVGAVSPGGLPGLPGGGPGDDHDLARALLFGARRPAPGGGDLIARPAFDADAEPVLFQAGEALAAAGHGPDASPVIGLDSGEGGEDGPVEDLPAPGVMGLLLLHLGGDEFALRLAHAAVGTGHPGGELREDDLLSHGPVERLLLEQEVADRGDACGGRGGGEESAGGDPSAAPPPPAHIGRGGLGGELVPDLFVLGDAGHVVGGALGSAGGAVEPIRADGAAVRGRLAADAGGRGVAGPERSPLDAAQLGMRVAAGPRIPA